MAINQFPQKLGIPSGNTAGRPGSPVIGDTYYDGTIGFLMIFDGTDFIPCSAPASQPSITVADVGTSQPYAAPTATVTFTEGVSGGKAAGFTAIQGSSSATSTSSPVTITISGPGTSLAFTGTSYNGFGISPVSLTVNQTITSVPQAPTIGTATASTSANEVTVTWTNGATGGKALSAITITPFLNGTTAETARTAATTSSTSYTFTEGQLTNNASYTFKVKATNANGTSLDSTASNSATVPNLVAIDYLVVAGGGAGSNGAAGQSNTGGGGAGGLRSTVNATGGGGSLESPLSLTKGTNYTVTVGAGAALMSNGTNSVFSTITSIGGGLGGGLGTNGAAGGSGGGGSHTVTTTGGAGTANQGFAGGNGAEGPAGGGGGAGEVGNTDGQGFGGDGVAVSITGSSVTYAGGGAGYTTGSPEGGTGGGANIGGAGTANTGGGGGGVFNSGSPNGGLGGSGVVILRWLTAQATITVGAGLTADSTGTDGSYSYKRITAGTGNVSFA
jgi:hypothetical protein